MEDVHDEALDDHSKEFVKRLQLSMGTRNIVEYHRFLVKHKRIHMPKEKRLATKD
jgi:hypothetical protein